MEANHNTPHETQRRLDFSRGEQLWMLRECRLPELVASDGVKVSSGVAKAVLRVIDEFAGGQGECFAAMPTIATTTGYSLRHVKRAVEVLQVMSVITCDRRKNRYDVVTNHYRVVWNELGLRCQVQAKTTTDQSALEVEQSAFQTDQSALESKPKCLGGTQSVRDPRRPEKKNTPPLPPRCSASDPVVVVVDDFSTGKQATIAIAENPATAVDQATTWQEAIAKVRGTGLRYGTVDVIVAEAQCRRMPPHTLTAAVEFYERHKHAWQRDGAPNPGVLTFFVRGYHAGDDPTNWQLWPSPDKAWQRRQQPSAEHDRQQRDRLAHRIVKEGKQRGCSEEQIRQVLTGRGLGWPGHNQ